MLISHFKSANPNGLYISVSTPGTSNSLNPNPVNPITDSIPSQIYSPVNSPVNSSLHHEQSTKNKKTDSVNMLQNTTGNILHNTSKNEKTKEQLTSLQYLTTPTKSVQNHLSTTDPLTKNLCIPNAHSITHSSSSPTLQCTTTSIDSNVTSTIHPSNSSIYTSSILPTKSPPPHVNKQNQTHPNKTKNASTPVIVPFITKQSTTTITKPKIKKQPPTTSSKSKIKATIPSFTTKIKGSISIIDPCQPNPTPTSPSIHNADTMDSSPQLPDNSLSTTIGLDAKSSREPENVAAIGFDRSDTRNKCNYQSTTSHHTFCRHEMLSDNSCHADATWNAVASGTPNSALPGTISSGSLSTINKQPPKCPDDLAILPMDITPTTQLKKLVQPNTTTPHGFSTNKPTSTAITTSPPISPPSSFSLSIASLVSKAYNPSKRRRDGNGCEDSECLPIQRIRRGLGRNQPMEFPGIDVQNIDEHKLFSTSSPLQIQVLCNTKIIRRLPDGLGDELVSTDPNTGSTGERRELDKSLDL